MVFIIMFTSKKEMVTSMEVLIVLKHMQQEKQTFCESVVHLQSAQTSTSLGCVPMTPSQVKEPWINLPNKLDGTCPKFWGFFNQVRLVIQLHPHCYPNYPTHVGLIGTLLLGASLTWFAPLLKRQSPLLNDFKVFVEEFSATFGDFDKEHTSTNNYKLFVRDHV